MSHFLIQNASRRGKSKLCERTDSVLQFHGRIMLESFAIVNDASTVFGKFLLDFGEQFCVAGIGDVGG